MLDKLKDIVGNDNKRAPKFKVYKSGKGYRWRLVTANGEPIAMGEEYATKAGAVKGTEAVKRAAADAEVVEIDQ